MTCSIGSGSRRAARLRSEPGVDGLALQGEHPEHALVHAVQRLLPHEPLERLDPECELPDRERPLVAEVPFPKALEIFGRRVLRAVDDPEVLRTTDLDARLDQSPAAPHDAGERLDDHPLTTGSGELLPQSNTCLLAL